jgi:AraC-like DNA-binding protein
MEAGTTERAHILPAAYGIPLLDLAKRWGIGEAALLGGFDLTPEHLTDPCRSLPLDVAIAIYERAVALTREPALGIHLGLQMRASAHGILGFAAMSAGTVRDAVLLAVRYVAIRTTIFSLKAQVVDGVGALVLEEHADLRGAREAYAFAVLVGFWSMGRVLTGRPLNVTFDFAFPRPGYYDRFESMLPPARFEQPGHQIILRDLDLLGAPLLMADAASMRMAREQCDAIFRSMGLDGRIEHRVRRLLASHAEGLHSLKTIARAMRLSPRTFRRYLEAEGLNFSALADDERRRRALVLLRSHELSVKEVGERLGYSDVANFSRAFRRWTGRSPTAYREGPS